MLESSRRAAVVAVIATSASTLLIRRPPFVFVLRQNHSESFLRPFWSIRSRALSSELNESTDNRTNRPIDIGIFINPPCDPFNCSPVHLKYSCTTIACALAKRGAHLSDRDPRRYHAVCNRSSLDHFELEPEFFSTQDSGEVKLPELPGKPKTRPTLIHVHQEFDTQRPPEVCKAYVGPNWP